MWYKIIAITEWFGEMTERFKLIRDFNRAAKMSFINGEAPTLLQSRITIGESAYRHSFSRLLGGGFRIKAMTGRTLKHQELVEVGRVVLDDEVLVRKLVALGWDTLEVHSNEGYSGAKWPLMEHARIGGYLK